MRYSKAPPSRTSNTAVTIKKEVVHIDPQALFQRLTVVATHGNVDANEVFKHELCSYPTALFEAPGSPREAHKAVLGAALWNHAKSHEATPSAGALYVLDDTL